MYYRSLYKQAPPVDFDAYTAALKANLAEVGRFEALEAMIDAPKAPCEARIGEVHVPCLLSWALQIRISPIPRRKPIL